VRTNFVLIDSENVKPESIEKLKHEHFRVVVFVGTNQKRLDFPIVHAVHSLGSNGSYVQVQATEEAARRSRFKPTLVEGKPATVKGIVTYNFM
jgi:hypothetical protein